MGTFPPEPLSRRVTVITPDVLTRKMAGPAIRAWQMSTALAADHEVELVTISTVCQITSDTFNVRMATPAQLRDVEAWADILIIQGFVLEGHPFLRRTAKMVIADLYDPLHLEQLELARGGDDAFRRHALRRANAEMNAQLLRGDYFMCASAKQRDFWLGQMSALGRVNPLTYDEDESLESLMGVVPFGLPELEPRHSRRAVKGVVPGIEEGDEVILWGGGIWDWFDPLTLVRAVDRLRHRRPRVRLFFMGLRPPSPLASETRTAHATRQLAQDLGLTGSHVFFNDEWVEYDDRQNYLLESDVGVSTHLRHIETAFSFRTRILDYIWSGLPIVATEGDSLADLVESEQLGITVPAGDVEKLEQALFAVLDDPAFAASCRAKSELVRGRLTWPQAFRPLVQFCRQPRRAPDLVDVEMAMALRGGLRVRPPKQGWGRDLELARGYLRSGDPRLMASGAKSRMIQVLGRRLGAFPLRRKSST